MGSNFSGQQTHSIFSVNAQICLIILKVTLKSLKFKKKQENLKRN